MEIRHVDGKDVKYVSRDAEGAEQDLLGDGFVCVDKESGDEDFTWLNAKRVWRFVFDLNTGDANGYRMIVTEDLSAGFYVMLCFEQEKEISIQRVSMSEAVGFALKLFEYIVGLLYTIYQQGKAETEAEMKVKYGIKEDE